MSDFRPVMGIEFDDKYIDAKNKLIDFLKALNQLTLAQKEQLTREYLTSAVFSEFMQFMNNGGRW